MSATASSPTNRYVGEAERIGREDPRRARAMVRAIEQAAREAADCVTAARALALSGKLAIAMGEFDDAYATAARLETIRTRCDHPVAHVAGLTFQAQLAFFLGAYRDAIMNATRAIGTADASGDRTLRVAARRGTCIILGNLGAPSLGEVLAERHALADEDDPWDLAMIHNDLACLAIDRAAFPDAQRELDRAWQLAETVTGPTAALRATVTATRAQLALATGQLDVAGTLIDSARDHLLVGGIPHPYLQGMTTLVAMQIATEAGEMERAECEGRAGLAQTGNCLPMVRGAILGVLADVLRRLGRLDEAYATLSESVALERDASQQFVSLQHDLSQAVRDHIDARTEAAALRDLADRDWLTGLYNRRFLATARFMGSGTVGVAAVDLDDFKSVNDTHGHSVGDRVIARVARLLLASARVGDVVVRLGGDEFVVVMPGATARAVDVCAHRLLEVLLDEPWDDIAPGVGMGASVGYAVGSDHDPVERILDEADRCLYLAKSLGRGRVVGSDRLGETVPSLG